MTQRLIDADALKESVHAHDYVLKDCLNSTDKGMFTVGIMQAIDEQPTVDAEPVRHGKWIWKGEEGDSRFMCSVCKWKEYVPTCNGVPDIWDYCPSCGARMDEHE